jgi:7-carboxy-7-deazaguanine synthase
MRVVEIYKSLQGEGALTGTESVFVRVSGCNLRCRFCDTPFTSWNPEGDDLAVHEVLEQVAEHACDYVVLTGGEPMLYSELIPLCAGLKMAGFHVTIETAGTLYLPLECDLMSISPKLSNSTPSAEQSAKWQARHERTRHAANVIRRLTAEHAYQIKFVIQNRDDCDEVERYLAEFPELNRRCVMLMPEGTEVATLQRTGEWLQPYCEEQGLSFCPRKQVEWFGFVRGT